MPETWPVLAGHDPQISQMTQIQNVNRDAQTYAMIGAAMEVHGQLGHGFLEAVYQDALAFEFAERGIPFEREVPLPISYKERRLPCIYRADLVCHGEIVVELKASGQLTG